MTISLPVFLWFSALGTLVYPDRALAFAASASSSSSSSSSSASSIPDYVSSDCNNTVTTAEVVGGAGRMGSLVLSSTARAVPRGIAPGCLSQPGTPIYVATPAHVWPAILQSTPTHRRDDLVWFGNGIPPTSSATSDTVVVPHFGVLQVNADPVTSPTISPPTFVFGKHATTVQQCLQARGVHQVRCLKSREEILMAAAKKLLWASSLWLLCHNNNNDSNIKPPRTVVQIDPDRELKPLVRDELLPALAVRWPNCHLLLEDDDDVDVEECMEYLVQYSRSMPQAIPNRELCRSEWKERNAFFLAVRDQVPQPIHEALLRDVGGISQTEIENIPTINTQRQNNNNNTNEEPSSSSSSSLNQRIEQIPSLGLSVVGTTTTPPSSPTTTNQKNTPVQTAIVVGGGILGCSVALHLARQGVQVQVLDAQSTSTSAAVGKTTPASWAWLNANGKSPPEYAWLNQLGMDGWKRDPILRNLPTWSGALVRFAQPLQQLHENNSDKGGYRVEGPLTQERIEELEPAADFTQSGYVYFFPDEGFVDPSEAVRTMREEAITLGVSFQGGVNVTGFTRNEQHKINGVTAAYIATEHDGSTSTTTSRSIQADVVVLAAGIGMAGLGNIPLLHRPGQIAFAKQAFETKAREKIEQHRLQRILVDTVRESHVLQRKDGTFVTGGGALEVGGKGGTTALQTTGESKDSLPLSTDDTLVGRARQMLPGLIGDLVRCEHAVRPIPLDGLPAVGYLDSGLYAVVSHSGITLAPILGGLAATEIAKGMTIDTLETFRPTRFLKIGSWRNPA